MLDYLEMSGNFSDWTLADAQWYFEQLGHEILIDGDRNRIFVC